MKEFIMSEDVIAVIKSFLACNEGDEATECLVLSIGAELLDVSEETLMEMIEKYEAAKKYADETEYEIDRLYHNASEYELRKMGAFNNLRPDIYLEKEELLECDIKTGKIKVDKQIFDDFAPNTYINIQFADTDSEEVLQYVMTSEDDDGIYMEQLVG